jgi:hypothetical protein
VVSGKMRLTFLDTQSNLVIILNCLYNLNISDRWSGISEEPSLERNTCDRRHQSKDLGQARSHNVVSHFIPPKFPFFLESFLPDVPTHNMNIIVYSGSIPLMVE